MAKDKKVVEIDKGPKVPVSIKLNRDAWMLMERLVRHFGAKTLASPTRTDVVEHAIRELAKKEKVTLTPADIKALEQRAQAGD